MKNNSNNDNAEIKKDLRTKAMMDNIDVVKKLTWASRIPLDIGLGEGAYTYT